MISYAIIAGFFASGLASENDSVHCAKLSSTQMRHLWQQAGLGLQDRLGGARLGACGRLALRPRAASVFCWRGVPLKNCPTPFPPTKQ